ncbi:response regulator [Hydrogenimonas thermophila]|uniref:GGDEF domain-containing response regulator n=1 Tax=Hydrogenimonas thermophila TaxID=223786 RepID=UPI0029373806|nr:response regulator [Hydrogenimonas thermophila]WOE70540.1 response regulator [Hydrogenimonas thermophila]WOE73056.1 response regulator [Hydrogenimonas thermophila]
MNVLIVDDKNSYIDMAIAFLEDIENIKLYTAISGKEALIKTTKVSFDLILLDIIMPNMDGFEVCKRLKQHPRTKDIPVIFLTSENSLDFIIKAFEYGAIDYINKPFTAEELRARVNTQLKLYKTVKELKAKQSQLVQLSIIDPLTKIYNFTYLKTKLKYLLDNKERFWFIHIQIDNLGKISKVFGHNQTEKLLLEFVEVLNDIFADKNMIFRLYGAHFGVIIQNQKKENIEKLLNSFLIEIKNLLKTVTNVNCFIVANLSKESDSVSSLLNRSDNLIHRHYMLKDKLQYLIEE